MERFVPNNKIENCNIGELMNKYNQKIFFNNLLQRFVETSKICGFSDISQRDYYTQFGESEKISPTTLLSDFINLWQRYIHNKNGNFSSDYPFKTLFTSIDCSYLENPQITLVCPYRKVDEKNWNGPNDYRLYNEVNDNTIVFFQISGNKKGTELPIDYVVGLYLDNEFRFWIPICGNLYDFENKCPYGMETDNQFPISISCSFSDIPMKWNISNSEELREFLSEIDFNPRSCLEDYLKCFE